MPAKKKGFNGLTPSEWTKESRNVWADLSSPRNKYQLKHGAVFPEKLAERIIKIYSGEKDTILDPFNGIGTTTVSAYKNNRKSIGIELNKEFYKISKDWIENESNLLTSKNPQPEVFNDDCRNLLKYVEKDSVKLSFTSPPYANFIQRSLKDREKTHKKSKIKNENNSTVKQYSKSKKDFGNLEYEEFLKELKPIFSDLLEVTESDGYSVWVVKDYRMTPKIPYVSFHSDIAKVAQDAGWLWQDLIIWDQNAQRRLVLLGYPTRFYTNQNCSFIVVFRKR